MSPSEIGPTRRSRPIDPRYVEARRVLLDALVALAPHGPAFIVAGAQAVYLRTGDADLAVAPYTTDGDLVLDPSLLAQDPAIETAMDAAGFHLSLVDGHVEPGIWVASATVHGNNFLVPVDLIVPERAAPQEGRRGARLGPHGRRAARRAVGLEVALVDHSPMTISTMDRSDDRSLKVEVAGTAALLASKCHKLHDRVTSDRTDRLDDKDAADVFRVMQTTPPDSLGAQLSTFFDHPIAGQSSIDAVQYVSELFGRRGRPGIEMASRALRVGVARERVEGVCLAYTAQLRAAIGW